MSPRDLIYVGHMLDMPKKAVGKTQGVPRAVYDTDDVLWRVATEDLHTLIAALEPIVPS